MGTLISLLVQWLISGNAFDPYIVNFMSNQWQRGVVILKAVVDSKFVQWRNGEVEKFDDPVTQVTLRGRDDGCLKAFWVIEH
uniref:Uncharacterized protein n=1 Tax=Romanomermis culicivorax TaxID=13658 RepID=A0A915JRC1_ROMCU